MPQKAKAYADLHGEKATRDKSIQVIAELGRPNILRLILDNKDLCPSLNDKDPITEERDFTSAILDPLKNLLQGLKDQKIEATDKEIVKKIGDSKPKRKRETKRIGLIGDDIRGTSLELLGYIPADNSTRCREYRRRNKGTKSNRTARIASAAQKEATESRVSQAADATKNDVPVQRATPERLNSLAGHGSISSGASDSAADNVRAQWSSTTRKEMKIFEEYWVDTPVEEKPSGSEDSNARSEAESNDNDKSYRSGTPTPSRKHLNDESEENISNLNTPYKALNFFNDSARSTCTVYDEIESEDDKPGLTPLEFLATLEASKSRPHHA